jgi:ectoine hydroxylase-related dioxygenase (phytanoyl-CoA dioxygenase family)
MYSDASSEALSMIEKKLYNINEKAHKLGINASLLYRGAYFKTEPVQNLPWHQDAFGYYTCQNHWDYLNFYIPIIKPDKKKSNLSVVPCSTLEKKFPNLYNRIKGKGATKYIANDDKTEVIDEYLGEKIYEMNCSIDDISITPELEPGDLLLMRGDIIHKTQDIETERVALSVRMISPDQLVSYKKLIKGSNMKTRQFVVMRNFIKPMIRIFRKTKKENIRVIDLLTVDFNVENDVPYSIFTFKCYLFYLKMTLKLRHFFGLKAV